MLHWIGFVIVPFACAQHDVRYTRVHMVIRYLRRWESC